MAKCFVAGVTLSMSGSVLSGRLGQLGLGGQVLVHLGAQDSGEGVGMPRRSSSTRLPAGYCHSVEPELLCELSLSQPSSETQILEPSSL